MVVSQENAQAYQTVPSGFKRNISEALAGPSELALRGQVGPQDEGVQTSKRVRLPRLYVPLENHNTLQQLMTNLSALLRSGQCDKLQNLRHAVS